MTPQIVDRSEMIRLVNDALTVEPKRTAVVTVDCHRGHLDPEVATMPVGPEEAARVVAGTARLLEFARGAGMGVIHVILQNRVLPDGVPEPMRNPFWSAVESVNEQLTPERESTISGHNLVGSVQTELMPELGPEPTDIVISTKRRLSIFRDTDLDLTLHELGVDTVVLAGINTNTCVLCAAFESLNRDLKTIVISDCVHSMYGDDLHVFGLQNIARCLGWVLTVDELIAKAGARRAVGAA
jgi:nicotinamidase-related amidase